MTPHHLISAAVALALFLLMGWCALGEVFLGYSDGSYGKQDRLRFTNDIRVREFVDEKTWGEGQRKWKIYQEGKPDGK